MTFRFLVSFVYFSLVIDGLRNTLKVSTDSCPVEMLDDYPTIVRKLRTSFEKRRTFPVEYRIKQLKAIHQMTYEWENDFVMAAEEDLKKPKSETILTDIDVVRNEVLAMLNDLRNWVKPQQVETGMANSMDTCVVQSEPLGLVLIIGAWNYPLNLTLTPLAGAIAAGNCVLLKPSEHCPKVSALVEKTVHKYLDPDCYTVINGGIEETTEILKERFDFILYTGNFSVGRIIHEAANKFLTPVALELGGKSPVFLDESVDMLVATRRLLWAKYLNCGQTCVGPDYLLCTERTRDTFLDAARKVLIEFFTENAQKSDSFGRIVNEKQFVRLVGYLTSGKIAIGGKTDKDDLYIEPTILVDILPFYPIMQEEIFGPILPILTVKGPSEAVDFINLREKPLSLYVFSSKKEVISLFQQNTSSGNFVANDAVIQFSMPSLPFGGVGNSGMGRYHGKYSFECFSHKKSVLIRNYNPVAEMIGRARYPPYTEKNLKVIQMLCKQRRSIFPEGTRKVVAFLLGFLAAGIIWLIVDQSS